MTPTFKNKTLATFLASFFGGVGLHRFYLFGKFDFWGWAHLVTLPISALAIWSGSVQNWLFLSFLLVLSILSGFLEALVIGLTPDERWDARFNAATGRLSDSGWTVALLLIFTLGGGAMSLIWVMARSFDLLFTGGAYG